MKMHLGEDNQGVDCTRFNRNWMFIFSFEGCLLKTISIGCFVFLSLLFSNLKLLYSYYFNDSTIGEVYRQFNLELKNTATGRHQP